MFVGLSNLADLITYPVERQWVRGRDSAVISGDLSLSWSELDERTKKLAGVLHHGGVNHGDRVGIYLHKSIESLVAVHGVLRSGAAYVPLDPMAPAETTASIIDDCGISVLITSSPAARRLSNIVSKTVARSEDHSFLIVGASKTQLGLAADDAHQTNVESITWADVATSPPIRPQKIDIDGVAYVMYTSGSTGTPKGIVHTHRSGVAYAKNAASLYGLGPEDRMASVSPLHFDMSLLEFFAGVLAGSTIVIVAEPYLKVPASLSQLLVDQRCTTLYAVPSLFQQLLDRGGLSERDLSALRWVLPAGEVFPVEPLRRLFAQWSHARFSNIYGPAEVNQCSYFTFDTSEAIPMDGPLPIGRPWQDTRFRVVDDDDRPVPNGERGMLLVATSTMMRGYWKRPDLDANAFVDLTEDTGETVRWYRTGDIVVVREDGEYVFLGRRDNQTKVRGHRVELEMVEDAVCGLPGVAQAVVGPRALASGDTQLVAFYQSASASQELEATQFAPGEEFGGRDEWRTRLAEVLPAYAVPTVFAEVAAFPSTPSGKIDRRSVREAIQQAADGQLR